MAVVKSLKNNKHKKIWTKIYSSTKGSTTSLVIHRSTSKKSPKKPFVWYKTINLTSKKSFYQSTLNLIHILVLLTSFTLSHLVNVYIYFYIYNITLVTTFWIILTVISKQFLTLQSFNNFSFNSYYVFLLTLLLFSMAGVPPFLGFFSKLLVFVNNVNNDFFLLYSLLFIILFVGLYFYIQNIRFLHSTNYSTMNFTYLINERVSLVFNYFTIWVTTFLVLGSIAINDIDLFFQWLFV